MNNFSTPSRAAPCEPDQSTSARRGTSIKVTQVLYSGLGGHASVAFSLLSGDSMRQWNSSLLYVGIEPLAPAYSQRTRRLGIPFESIQSRPGRPWRSWPSVYAALRRLRPDTVILHSISSLPPVALYCLVRGIPMIAVEHTPIALRSRAERIMSAFALVLAKRIVVLTEAYKNAYLTVSSSPKLARKIDVIPNGIDAAAFSRLGRRDPDGKFRIGMAARFASTKRQDVLVLALVQLIRKRPDVHWQLTLAGDGECLEPVRDLANSNGVADRVNFVGHLDETGLIEWFRSLDVYVHASEGEALSTSMLQAMSMELPMVASGVPGITSLLDNEGTQLGVVTAANTPQAFADGIAALQSDPALQERLGSSCRERVSEAYTQEAMFYSYNNLIQEYQK